MTESADASWPSSLDSTIDGLLMIRDSLAGNSLGMMDTLSVFLGPTPSTPVDDPPLDDPYLADTIDTTVENLVIVRDSIDTVNPPTLDRDGVLIATIDTAVDGLTTIVDLGGPVLLGREMTTILADTLQVFISPVPPSDNLGDQFLTDSIGTTIEGLISFRQTLQTTADGLPEIQQAGRVWYRNPRFAIGAVVTVVVLGVGGAVLLSGGDSPSADPAASTTSSPSVSSTSSSVSEQKTTTAPAVSSAVTTDTVDTVDILAPVDPQCVTAADATGVDHSILEEVWQRRMERAPDWQTIADIPTDLGPSITSYGVAMWGPNLVVVMELDAAPVDTGFLGAGTQLGVGFASGPDSVLTGSGDFDEGFGYVWYLTPAEGLEGFDAASGYAPLQGGTGLISGACAIWHIPVPEPPLFIRFTNFWRQPSGTEASAGDPTAFQASEPYGIVDGVLAPA